MKICPLDLLFSFTKHTFSSASAKVSDVGLGGYDPKLFHISKMQSIQLPHISLTFYQELFVHCPVQFISTPRMFSYTSKQ